MPVRIFSDDERDRLSRCPPDILPEDVTAFFTLSVADREFLRPFRGAANQVGVALQLGLLRYLGFCPDDLQDAPASAVASLARQLGVAPQLLSRYGTRAQTRTDHLGAVQRYLGFRDADMFDLQALESWLLERALEHDKPTLLFAQAAGKLQADKIVRPGITRLERLVAAARSEAWEETFRRATPLLTPERRAMLDGLLRPDLRTNQAPLIWLRLGATANTPPAIRQALTKLAFLNEREVATWPQELFTPNRRKFLAQLARRSTPQALQRTPDERRYPILLAFLQQSLVDITDEAVELFDRCVADVDRRAKRDLAEFRQRIARSTNVKIHLLMEVLDIVLDPDIPDAQIRPRLYARRPPPELRAIAEDCLRQVRPLNDTYFDFVERRYGYLRQCMPDWLATLSFQAQRAHDPLVAAVDVLRRLNAERRTKIPPTWDVPLAFVPPKWLHYVVDADGVVQRHYYELCVLWELRGALRAGHVWVEHSRRYADPATYLIPPDMWAAERAQMCDLLQAPADGATRLATRGAELEAELARFDKGLPRSTIVRIEQGKLVVSPLPGEEIPPRVEQLADQIEARLPEIDLPSLVVDVDQLTHFSDSFEHAGGAQPRMPRFHEHLYAAILAQSCNFGLTQMARITDLSYEQLAWSTTWYLREETLGRANAALVNYHHHLPLTQVWGGGTMSSSDGQRLPVAVKAKNARPLPKYYGYGRGLTHYIWSSDQHSQYGTKVTPSTDRDATYVLDLILDNETELPIVEHTTDTHGVTDIVFALFDLLGLQFSPRIKDIGSQHLYRLDPTVAYRHLGPFLKTLNRQRILDHWDDMLRVAASLKRGWVTASLFIAKLQAYPRQNDLALALQEYGCLVRTIFILRYLQSDTYRRRITVQLNKGETLNGLRQFILFANEGKIRHHYPDDHANQASCLTLVTNMVVVWMTVYMAEAIATLREEGYTVPEEDLVHVSPARSGSINRYGKYRFNLRETQERTGLRPLRTPGHHQAERPL